MPASMQHAMQCPKQRCGHFFLRETATIRHMDYVPQGPDVEGDGGAKASSPGLHRIHLPDQCAPRDSATAGMVMKMMRRSIHGFHFIT